MMEMKDLGDALIGDLDAGVGISIEERKRLTIGMELVAKPHILFLDGMSFRDCTPQNKLKLITK
jgi:ATP-binding cassette subfamily G (WHITE) protein 2 (SNQ2)